MGNANGGEEGGDSVDYASSDRTDYPSLNSNPPGHVASSDSMSNSPPESPSRSRSPLMFTPQDYVPESLDSVAEFEPPPSPGSSYGHVLPGEDDFAKEPVMVPPQLHLTVLGMQNTDEVPSRPQHVVLNHLFIEKGLAAAQSVVALGLTHRFESKYVTVVLYKPLRRLPHELVEVQTVHS